ncbi:DUF397 domain-containing protein [Spirillospora sp. NPDC029432]|uniref:DUF397 domain-containing protein n=1 Tax=Spirillospora sp. NPDC029432 TaxID=3154599 RepID=UPI0034562D3E
MTVLWRKSSRSVVGDDKVCVELARIADSVGVRDSKNPDGGHLTLAPEQFASLVNQIKRGSYDD